MRLTRILVTVAAVAALLPLAPGAALAVHDERRSAGVPASSMWAWVTVRRADDSYTPAAKDRGNSAGETNSVTASGNGGYTVVLRGVGDTNGVILISTFGATRRTCVASDWYIFDTGTRLDQVIGILCYTPAGVPANAKFVVNWLVADGVGGRLAYGWNASPTSDCGEPVQEYNSTGDIIETCPAEGSSSIVKIHSLGSNKGIVHVSANARHVIEEDPSPGICYVESFFPEQPGKTLDEHVRSRCVDDTAFPIYRNYFFAFMQGLGMKGVDRTRVAYVLADQPAASSYTPFAAHRYSSAGGVNRVTRQGAGSYTVILPGMPLGGSAQVTPVGAAERQCSIASIAKTGSVQRVGVRCWDLDGDPRNTQFALSFAR